MNMVPVLCLHLVKLFEIDWFEMSVVFIHNNLTQKILNNVCNSPYQYNKNSNSTFNFHNIKAMLRFSCSVNKSLSFQLKHTKHIL